MRIGSVLKMSRKSPAHWGPPPGRQTRDICTLPGGYGTGSTTLALWIQKKLEVDAPCLPRGELQLQQSFARMGPELDQERGPDVGQVKPCCSFRIIPFHPQYAGAFRAINLAWINHYFHIEPHDEETLADPSALVARGGHILIAVATPSEFAAPSHAESVKCADPTADDATVLGVVALLNPACFGLGMELAKMGVRESARGQGIGRALGVAAVALARVLQVLFKLYYSILPKFPYEFWIIYLHQVPRIDILSNRRLTPALSLYRSLGFVEVLPLPTTDYVSNNTVWIFTSIIVRM